RAALQVMNRDEKESMKGFPEITAAKAALLLSSLALAACPCTGKKQADSSPLEIFEAVHLVKITYQGEDYVIRGRFAGNTDNFVLKAENEIGVSIFTVTWDGFKLKISPAGSAVASQVPFDLRNIAVDIWRVVALWSKDDIRKYNRCNDPDLPEDALSAYMEKEFVTVKTLFRKKEKETVAKARYYSSIPPTVHPFLRASAIRYENAAAGYTIVILQTPAGK
ncbi:MAG: hypothetical protein ABIJ56_18295, partial [Pseudomonadota bacterium]